MQPRRLAAGCTALLLIGIDGSGGARTAQLQPFIDLRQIASFDSGDAATTYTEVTAGLDASIDRRRVKGQIAYSYSRRIVETGDLAQNDRHNLTARVSAELLDRRLTVEAGGLAALVNSDLRGNVSFNQNDANANLTQTYSAYVQPKLHLDLGSALFLDSSYRLGWSNAGGTAQTGTGAGGAGLPPGAIPVDRGSSSINQQVTAAVSNNAASSRFRWTLSGQGLRETSQRLDQVYRTYSGTFDVQYRIVRQIGLIATLGYEDILSTERNFLTDAAGNPIPDANGAFQLDPLGSRRRIYARSGATYEGGVAWAPSRRSGLTVRAGKRYGNFNVNGDARFQVTSRLGVTASLQQSIESFGRLLTQQIGGIPTSFFVPLSFGTDIGQCVFGTDPTTGACISGATQSITDAQFRNTTAQVTVAGEKSGTRYGLGLVYTRRRFLDSHQLQDPNAPMIDPSITQGSDRTLSANAQASHRLGQRSTVSASAFVNRNKFALQQNRTDTYAGASLGTTTTLGKRLSLVATASANRRFATAAAPRRDSAQLTAGLRARF